jgi:hypothetical protein
VKQFLAKLAENVDWLCLVGAVAAWVGLWGAWIPHPTAALTHNAVDLAEWAGFLSDVQFGDLHGMPDMLRVGIAAASTALAFSAGAIKKPTSRWGVRLLSLIMVIVLLPPYPEIFELWRSENYGVRFLVAVGAVIGLALGGLADAAPAWVRRVGVAITGTLAIWQALRAYLAFRPPFSAHYAYPTPYPIQPGWGVYLFIGGLIIAGASAMYALLTPRSL